MPLQQLPCLLCCRTENDDDLVAMGADARKAEQEVAALFAHIVGLLLLSHTGRIRMFRDESRAMFDRYVDNLIEREQLAAAAPRKRPAKTPRS